MPLGLTAQSDQSRLCKAAVWLEASPHQRAASFFAVKMFNVLDQLYFGNETVTQHLMQDWARSNANMTHCLDCKEAKKKFWIFPICEPVGEHYALVIVVITSIGLYIYWRRKAGM